MANKYFTQVHYGDSFENVNPEDMRGFAMALIKIVGADGFSDSERWAFREIGLHLDAPAEMIDQMLSVDPASINLEECLKNLHDSANARAMLYDAIVISSADGYSEEEQANARKAAKLLGISESVLKSLESLYLAEVALRKMKAALLFG